MIVRKHFEIAQTAVTIVTDESYLGYVKNAIYDARNIIEEKISEDPFFGITFDPYPVNKNDNSLIQHMCQASISANVGPMASVAAAIGFYAVSKAVENGCEHIIVDNGGDITMYTSEEVYIGIFSGNDTLSGTAIKVPATSRIVGICSSSGKIGPSVSFGNSSICTVFSDDAILADACATAYGNMIKTGKSEELSEASEKICSIEGVNGCICSCNGMVSMCGDVPKLVRANVDENKISFISLS